MSTTNNKSTNFQLVRHFCKVFGQPTPAILQRNILEENPKLMQFRLSLIEEEIRELNEAFEENNMIEVIDALNDIEYVVYGMGVTIGSDLDEAFKIIHETIMSKLYINEQEAFDTMVSYKSLSNFQTVVNFLKLIGHAAPDNLQKNIIEENPKLVQFRLSMIEQHFKKLKKAVEENNMTKVIITLVNIIFDVYSMGVTIGVDLDETFKIVHESNMSKLCRTEQEAMDTLLHYKTVPDFANVNVKYRSSDDGKYFVVYNGDTGKVLKSKYFTLPDFSKLMA